MWIVEWLTSVITAVAVDFTAVTRGAAMPCWAGPTGS